MLNHVSHLNLMSIVYPGGDGPGIPARGIYPWSTVKSALKAGGYYYQSDNQPPHE